MKIKSLLLNVLSVGMLFSGFLALNTRIEQNVNPGIEEVGIEYNNHTGIKLADVKAAEIEGVEYSKTYAQYAKDSEGKYYVRFATAIKASSLDSIVYHRAEMVGADETVYEASDIEVTTVYSHLTANGVNTYFDGTDLVSEPNENTKNYYWACYTIKFGNENFHKSNLSVTLDINETSTENVKEITLTKLVNDSINNSLDVDSAYAVSGATTKYRMEGECADIHYINNKNDVTKDTFSDFYCIAFSDKLSNNLATRNLNNCPDSHLTFNFNSSHSYKVKLNLMISAHGKSTPTFDLSKYIRITNDGIVDNENVRYQVDLSEKSFTWEEAVPLVWGGDVNDEYWRFKNVEVEVGVYKGANSLTINMIGVGGANIDYIELDSSATFDGFDNTHYNDDDSRWFVETKPTDTETGVLTVEKYFGEALKQYSYGIPALKDESGNLNPLYKVEDYGYSFRVKNETLKIKIGAVSTITIDDENVKFANGRNKLTKDSGQLLTDVDLSLVDGRKVTSFDVYDAVTNARLGVAKVGSYVFPDDDVILRPRAFIMDGFTQLDPTGEQGTRKPQKRSEGTNFDETLFTSASTLGSIIVGKDVEGIYGEEGVQFGYTGTLPKGAIFRANTKVGTTSAVITMNKAHQWAYTFKNAGENPINLRLNQVNSGATVEPNDAGVELVLQPGEAKQFVITISFTKGSANKNALSLFTVLEDTVNLKMEMAMSVKLAK